MEQKITLAALPKAITGLQKNSVGQIKVSLEYAYSARYLVLMR